MDNKRNDLWQGGPWEQPSRPVLPPPRIPPHREYEEAYAPLRPRRRRRSITVPLLSILVVILGLACASLTWDNHALRKGYQPQNPVWDSSQTIPEYYPQHHSNDLLAPPALSAGPLAPDLELELFPSQGTPLSFTEIYQRCAPSLVSIYTVTPTSQGYGTGIVLTEDGYLLTNAHVIARTTYAEVATLDGRVAEASVVGYDMVEDIAVLKVDLTGLTPARFGSSDDLRPGDSVCAIGDALGYRSTITDGIISALDREVEVDGITMNLIQTSAAINYGNSGGALIDRYGQVVGITTIKLVSDAASPESMGFAIPSLRVKYVTDRLLAGEKIVPGLFGITVSTIPPAAGGLEVLEVDPRSDSYAKGIRAGDILVMLNGSLISTVADLNHAKLSRGAGDTVLLTALRGTELMEFEVALTDATLLQ